jgi:hypothetical protein
MRPLTFPFELPVISGAGPIAVQFVVSSKLPGPLGGIRHSGTACSGVQGVT